MFALGKPGRITGGAVAFPSGAFSEVDAQPPDPESGLGAAEPEGSAESEIKRETKRNRCLPQFAATLGLDRDVRACERELPAGLIRA